MLFSELKLIEPILKALSNEGYTTPTPIQQRSIPIILNRRDLLGCAQTGTGKTAAFAIPILQLLNEQPAQALNSQPANAPAKGPRAPIPIRSLILTPTRELAIQIGESFAAYGKFLPLKHVVIFGGVPQHPQVQALQKGVDILIATPGRLLDLIDQRYVHLQDIQLFVLDEADRMLDMGFVHDVKKVIARLPQKRQTLFFSATMPPEIQKLAASILVNPEKVEVTPVSSTADTIQQQMYFVDKSNKRHLLLHILKDDTIGTALVFARTKHGADKIAQGLTRAGISAEAIHGNKSQNARQRALQNFKSRQTRILVATDIAARGIDIDELTHVINYELPNVPETYVHRIGRTGRAGASGIAISFCDQEEKEFLRDIQKLIGRTVPVVSEHPFPMGTAPIAQDEPNGNRNAAGRSGNGNQRNGRQQNGNQRNGRQEHGHQRNGRQPEQQRNKRPENADQQAGKPENRRPLQTGNQRKDKPAQQPVQPSVKKAPILRSPDPHHSGAGRSVPENQPPAKHRPAPMEKEQKREGLDLGSGFPYPINQSAGDERL